MSVIRKIVRKEQRQSAKGKYWVTVAQLSDGSEIEGFGEDFQVGDKVQTFFDDRWGKAKMQK